MLVLLAAITMTSLHAKAVTHYVALTGGHNSPYTSWDDAATNIQAAVDVAASGSMVLVAGGRYVVSDTTATYVVSISNALEIRSTAGADATLIDAENKRSGVLINLGAGGTAVVSGFTIVNGNPSIAAGAGVRAYRGHAYLSDCVISNNTTSSSGGGGGVYYDKESGNLVISNCWLVNNTATGGGGGCTVAGSNALLVACHITDNVSAGGGGGIAALSTCTNLLIDKCVISSNETTGATYGGGIYCLNAAHINNCLIENNTAGHHGGGIMVFNYAPGYVCVSNSIIRNNEGKRSYMPVGGGIMFRRGNCEVTGCLITGNKALATGGGGGGLAVYENYAANIIIRNVTVTSNRCANLGGGLAVYSNANSIVVLNSIIQKNFSANTAYDNLFIHLPTSSSITFSNCCVAPLTQVSGVNNIDDDPLFRNVADGDFCLLKDSPCINTGVNQDWMLGAVDLSGHRRLDWFNRRVDMGCYEYTPVGMFFYMR